MAVPKKGRSKSLVRINRVNVLKLDTTRLNKKSLTSKDFIVLGNLTV
jgi:hypothetical protein